MTIHIFRYIHKFSSFLLKQYINWIIINEISPIKKQFVYYPKVLVSSVLRNRTIFKITENMLLDNKILGKAIIVTWKKR